MYARPSPTSPRFRLFCLLFILLLMVWYRQQHLALLGPVNPY